MKYLFFFQAEDGIRDIGVTGVQCSSDLGSLILGLYDDGGSLHVVGHTSGFTAKQKRELVATLQPYETGKTGMGDPSRWANDRELEWRELRPELVVEVTFDHVSEIGRASCRERV